MLRCAFWLPLLSLAACGGALPAKQTATDDAAAETASDVSLDLFADDAADIPACAEPCADGTCAADCAPHLLVTPAGLNWSGVTLGTPVKKTLMLRNSGHAPLTIASVTFATSIAGLSIDAIGGLPHLMPSTGKVTLPSAVTIAPGMAEDVTLTAQPVSFWGVTGTLVLWSDDPAAQNGTTIPLRLNAPCLLAAQNSLDFGGNLLGAGATNTVTWSNASGSQLCLTHLALTTTDVLPQEFSLDLTAMKAKCPKIDATTGPTPDQPCCLDPNATVQVDVRYTPGDISPSSTVPDQATLSVTTDLASCDTPTIAISGFGVSQACPLAKIDILEGDEVVPQTVLHLKGDGSKGTNGSKMLSYKWTVKQPPGSNKGFAPNSTFPNPTFTPDAAGQYEFCLDVVDANGVNGCAQACQIVLVVPNDAVHVELLWDTPADPDQTDTGPAAGADMDLHFASSNAKQPDVDCDKDPDPWFDNPYDCFWFNNAPQWGSSDPAIKDDPTMDLDDTDGAGPENVNLEQPEGTATQPHWYAIGAHYWNDNGFGVSYATITVYLYGTVGLKVDNLKLNPLDMLYLTKMNWPNQMLGGSTPPFTVCYETAGSKPGDVCAGKAKMWEAKGEWCITPCYVNKSFVATGYKLPANCP